jgi:hypothetical protein
LNAKLNDVQLCYFAALIEGLRVIDEKALDLGVDANIGDAYDALVHFVIRKGDRLLQIHDVQAAAAPIDRKARYGRGGIPDEIVDTMIDEYRRTNSLSVTARKFNRSRQSMWDILRRRIELNPVHKVLHEPVIYNGEKFTPGKDGYLRRTTGRRGENQLHRIVWIAHRGPILTGHQVMFRDGDRLNCAIDNLYCASRQAAATGRLSCNAWTKFYRGLGPRPVLTSVTRKKQSESIARAWAAYTVEQKKNRLRGIHRRWNERRAQRVAA